MASNSTPHRTPGTGRPRGRPRGSRTRHSFVTPGPLQRFRPAASSQRQNRFGRAHQPVATDAGAYKPREERSYTEFHPDFDIEADINAYDSREIDGSPLPISLSSLNSGKAGNGVQARADTGLLDKPSVASTSNSSIINGPRAIEADMNGAVPYEGSKHGSSRGDSESQASSHEKEPNPNPISNTPTRRSSRQKDNKERGKERSNLTPKPAQRPVLPMSNIHHNERLSLPVPSYKPIVPFQLAETYVDRAMAGVGFQETDYWLRPHTMVRNIGIQDSVNEGEAKITSVAEDKEDANHIAHAITPGVVEYDMDEQDDKWLMHFNSVRRSQDIPTITREIFEITITKIEREWYALEKMIPKQSAHAAHVKKGNDDDDDEDTSEDSKCQICDDGECENSNAIVFCDGCNIAVHQDCYGVPFIPEGQWLCRRCSLLAPRREVNCIFCPNTDGALKMTDSSLWSHLLCAIWIPEVTISNMVYMEPVEGIDLVPKSRWKLHCYICKQRMGACIQCSNKNCYLAFHVTCARKAKLYLSMRQVPADPSGATAVGAERNLIFDGSQLKAFCDKHVPTEWRKEYRTDIAIRNVQDYYENTFYDKEWGDSQTKALSGTHFAHNSGTSNVQKLTLTLGGKRKRPSAGVGSKTIWRLPSGAPVIPQILYNTVIEAISRFSVRKPKEYVAEICKYWTLKREARRDASLLKRLQVSASSNFTSDEVTKKDYSATFDGEEKLKRRLDFAIKLRHDLERIRLLADDIKKREKEKLRQAECLKEMIDAVYFPVTPILTQILERAQQLDSKDFFKVEFGQIKQKLHDRQYTTVYQFSRDILSTLTASVTSRSKFAATAILEGSEYIDDPIRGLWSAAATPAASNIANPLENIPSAVVPATSSAPLKVNKALGDTAGKTAGRILRVIQPMLENAKLQEIAMREDPNERMAGRVDERYQEILLERKKREEEFQAQFAAANEASRVGHITDDTAGDKMDIDNPATTEAEVNDRAVEVTIESMTASLSQSQQKDDEPDRIMGIPWYTKPFSPMGATLLSEERWMGMDVIRDMSPLSELDEDAIERLQRSETPDLFDSVEGDDGDFDGGNMSTAGSDESPSAKDKATSNMSSTATSNWAAAGTRVSLRATKGSKRVSYIEPEQHLQQMQAAETPRPKSSSRTGTREVDLEQVVVIGSTRSQTKQAINKAQRRGRGYVWVEVEEEKQGRRHRSRGDGLTEVDVDTTVAKDIDAMDIDSDLITGVETHFVDRGDEATNIVDDLPGSIDSPLTSVPDDPLDPGDRLSLHSDEMEALDQELDFGSNGAYRGEPEGVQSHPGSNSDNMETEHTDTEFHTPGEISNEERGTETMARELTDESAVEETPATATAAVVQETESQFHIEDSRSPSKRNARSSPRQRDGNSGVGAEDMMLPNARSPQRESIESGAMQSTPKKSPPAVSKGLESSPFSPVPMTTRSRRVLEVEATPSRRGSSRSRVAKKR